MPYSLSVPQAEQHALFELFQRVPDAFDVTIDCKSVQQLLQRAKAPLGGPIPWATVWKDRKRASVHWVNSHKDAAHFARMGWPQWRRLVNDDVDQLCRERFKAVFSESHRTWLKELDSLVRDVNYHLARKANHILHHRKDVDFPWKFRRDKTEEVSGKTPKPLVVPSAAFVKTQAPNKKQRIVACIAGTVDTLGHTWLSGSSSGTNFTMKCATCALYVQQTADLASFNRLMQHPCVGRGTVPACLDIHHSHNMINMGVQWSCLKCGRLQRPHLAKGSEALRKPCDGRSKAGTIAKQAQGVNLQTLDAAKPSVVVHKVKIPFGTSRNEQAAQAKPTKQSVLSFGQPSAVVTPVPKPKTSVGRKQTTLSFPSVSKPQ